MAPTAHRLRDLNDGEDEILPAARRDEYKDFHRRARIVARVAWGQNRMLSADNPGERVRANAP